MDISSVWYNSLLEFFLGFGRDRYDGRGGANMNQYNRGYDRYDGQGGGRGGYRDYGGGPREQSHANFGMRRDRRDSDRQNRPPYEELREPTAGERMCVSKSKMGRFGDVH